MLKDHKNTSKLRIPRVSKRGGNRTMSRNNNLLFPQDRGERSDKEAGAGAGSTTPVNGGIGSAGNRPWH